MGGLGQGSLNNLEYNDSALARPALCNGNPFKVPKNRFCLSSPNIQPTWHWSAFIGSVYLAEAMDQILLVQSKCGKINVFYNVCKYKQMASLCVIFDMVQ